MLSFVSLIACCVLARAAFYDCSSTWKVFKFQGCTVLLEDPWHPISDYCRFVITEIVVLCFYAPSNIFQTLD